MGNTGYVDWHRLTRIDKPWTASPQGHTSVYVFFRVDYGRSTNDHGVGLLKTEGGHPDWFIHAERADHVLAAYCQPGTEVSPNFSFIFDGSFSSKPLLAGLLLGTSDRQYTAQSGERWHASQEHLTRTGRKLVKDLSTLYLREPWILTFVDPVTDEDNGSRDPE